jgi:hypothetical protein
MNWLLRAEARYEDRLPDAYWKAVVRFRIWREAVFPWWFRWTERRRHDKELTEKFGFIPRAGDWLVDCRGQTGRIAHIDRGSPDLATFEDGFSCSLWQCCSTPRSTIR